MRLPESEENGLYGIYEDSVKNSRVFINRKSLVEYCKNFLTSRPVIAELGVFHGDFSEVLLDMLRPSAIHLIDIDISIVRDRFARRKNVHTLQGVSWTMLETLPDGSIDYIYIDGDPSYEGTKQNIEVSYRKIRNGGILQFNNYCNYSPLENITYGVVYAVNEFIECHNPLIIGISLDRRGYHNIALRIHKPIIPTSLRVKLNIVTPCSRPENLSRIMKSIKLDLIEKWYIIYDVRNMPFYKRFDHPKIVELACQDEGIVGHQIRNMALDMITEGLVYFLDDDTIMNIGFWDISDMFEENMIYTFDMKYQNGEKLSGSSPYKEFIDMGQYVFDMRLAKNIRFDVNDYCADGYFIQSLVKKHTKQWKYIPELGSYYNYLKWAV